MFGLSLSVLLGLSSGRLLAPEVGQDWKEVGKANTLEPVEVFLVLKRNPGVEEKLEKLFWEVSDPDHENYAEYLTQDEVTELMGIGDEQLKAVTDYLESHGAEFDVGAHKDLIRAKMQLDVAEEMFSTSLFKYQHTTRPRTSIVRARGNSPVSIPEELKELVTVVDNLSGFPKLYHPIEVELDQTETTGQFGYEYACIGNGQGQAYGGPATTPKVLQARYMTNGPLSYTEAQGSMSVAEFGSQQYSSYQLGMFSQQCHVNATIDRLVGSNDPDYCNGANVGMGCMESLLDIEYIRAVAGDVFTTDVHSNQYSIFGWAKTISDMGDNDIPLVNSVSYGNDEAQNYVSVMQQTNVEFKKLAVRGVSVMIAAGDQGVWGREGVENGQQFHPDFPCDSPYVTAVGGTNFATAGVIGEEEAWSSGGGGFSNIFPMPQYQANAVAEYKQQPGLPNASLWNQGNARAYPDVSALAGLRNPYLVFSGSKFTGVGGTSAATPVFSAIIAQLNSVRISKGGKALGFLNPWIYKNPHAFNDVTLGNNGSFQPGSGFPATQGWDAATGLGTPDFQKLLKAMPPIN